MYANLHGEYDRRRACFLLSVFVGASMQYVVIIICTFRNSQVLCKASKIGDFPSGAPSGMSLYERVIETLTTLFPLWVCVTFCRHNFLAYFLFFQCF